MPGTEARATNDSLAELHAEGARLVVVLAGEWSLERHQPRFEELLDREEIGRETARSDALHLGEWDSSLLIFLLQCQDYCDEHHLRASIH